MESKTHFGRLFRRGQPEGGNGADGSARTAIERLKAEMADDPRADEATVTPDEAAVAPTTSSIAPETPQPAADTRDRGQAQLKTAPAKALPVKREDSKMSNKNVASETQSSESPAEASAPTISMTILSPNLRMKGAEIDSDEDMTVHGHFDGKLRCRNLVVSAGATVRGEIKAEVARVSGALFGKVEADSLYLFKGSSLGGEVACRSMGIQPGSSVKANIHCDQTNAIDASEPLPQVDAPGAGRSVGTEGDFNQSNFLKLVPAMAS